MKKLIFTLLAFCAVYLQGNAQACGGVITCTGGSSLTKPGLAPVSECVSPVTVGSTDTVVIQFVNYDSVAFPPGGTTKVRLDSLQVVSITNLPAGLCWATNHASNTFNNQEHGCIQVRGTVTAAPGQYNLDITVHVWLSNGLDLTINAKTESLYYFVRVISTGDTCPHNVDTTNQSIGADSVKLYTAGQCPGTGITCYQDTFTSGIKTLINYVNSLSIVPNPMNTEAVVSFNSTKTGVLTERVTDILGNIISSRELQIVPGLNTSKVERGRLSAGMYIYSLNDGQSAYTRKIVITE